MKQGWMTYDRYEEAVNASARTDKPILLFFYSDSCKGCKNINNEVLADKEVHRSVINATIPVWVEVESVRSDPRITNLIGSHIFIMSPVLQLVSSSGNIFHKFADAPRHTRLDLGYTSVHHDVVGQLDAGRFLSQLELGTAKCRLFEEKFDQAVHRFSLLMGQPLDETTSAEVRYWMPIALNRGSYMEDNEAFSDLPGYTDVTKEVRQFCALISKMPASELMKDWRGSRGYGGWAHYTDCLREVCLGIYQTLLDLGHRATHFRNINAWPLTQAQLAVRDWHTSYRSLQGVLNGLSTQDWDRQHLHENYSLGKQRTIRNNIVHCVMAEFWAHGSAIRGAREVFAGATGYGPDPIAVTWGKFGPPPMNFGTRRELLGIWEQTHGSLVEEFSTLSDAELEFERSWWENSGFSIRFRLNRLGWHLQDHAAVIETICDRLGRARTETERLAMRIFTALGSAEGGMAGLPAEAKQLLCADTANVLRNKNAEIQILYPEYLAASRERLYFDYDNELTTQDAVNAS